MAVFVKFRNLSIKVCHKEIVCVETASLLKFIILYRMKYNFETHKKNKKKTTIALTEEFRC
jgi:hypothetical protein